MPQRRSLLRMRGLINLDSFRYSILNVYSFNQTKKKVTMETKEAAESAILDPNPVIDGRKANVNLAYLGVKSRIAQPTSKFLD